MRSLEFDNTIGEWKLSYTNRKELPVFFDQKGEFPLYMLSGNQDGSSFEYSDAVQFEGKGKTSTTLMEIMNKSALPVHVSVGGVKYLAAKGFLAHYHGPEKIVPIFMSVITGDKVPESMSDVKLYVCSEILRNERYKSIRAKVLDLISDHPGQTVLASDITPWFGYKLEIPAFKTIAEKNSFMDELVQEGLEWMKQEREE